MELLINGQSLALPLDFEIELEEVNPFFSEVGSQSLPITLPYTPRNLEMLGHPERIANTFKLDTEYEAVLRHGVLQKVGRLVIFSASKESGIETTFYLDEGDFYTQIKDVHMSNLNFSQNSDPFTGTYAEKAKQWLKHFERVQRGEVKADYAIFPVCTKIETSDDDNERFYDGSNCEFLNAPDPNMASSYVTSLQPLLGYNEREIDGVVCPVGYGVTPFLKLNYLLHTLFAHFGYMLQESILDTDPDLSKIVLLNNTADTICSGKLDYKQLVPSCAVTTFLDVIRNKFCCEFIIDGRTRLVHAKFMQELGATPVDMDLSPYLIEKPVISHEDFLQLKLTSGTSLEFAQPVTETMEQLFRENIYITQAIESNFGSAFTIANEVVMRNATGQFYKQLSENKNIKFERIGSTYFNYDKKTEKLKYDERESEDEQLPMLPLDVRFVMPGGTVYSTAMYCPFIGEVRHLNTGIKKDGEAAEEKRMRMM
jgi:hypothetical protein